MSKHTKYINPISKLSSEDGYTVEGGGTVCREHDTLTPAGNLMEGRWVYRDAAGTLIDFDQYRLDLFERNRLVERRRR